MPRHSYPPDPHGLSSSDEASSAFSESDSEDSTARRPGQDHSRRERSSMEEEEYRSFGRKNKKKNKNKGGHTETHEGKPHKTAVSPEGRNKKKKGAALVGVGLSLFVFAVSCYFLLQAVISQTGWIKGVAGAVVGVSLLSMFVCGGIFQSALNWEKAHKAQSHA